MGILGAVKSKIQEGKLKERAVQDPSPSILGELARFYILAGDNEQALDWVEEGLKRFPDSEILGGLSKFLTKSDYSREVSRAVQALESNASPRHYEALIRVYRRYGDLHAAADWARIFVKEYPGSVSAHRIMGEVRLCRFMEDHAARDGRAARASLERALELDEEDLLTNLFMGRLFFHCGLTVRARKHLEKIAHQGAVQEEAEELLKALETIPEADSDPDLRFFEIEERGRGFFDLPRSVSNMDRELIEDDPAGIRECLEKALDIPGLLAAAFVDHEGRVYGSGREGWGGDWEEFGRFAALFARTANKASLRMDLGALEKSVVETEDGAIFIREALGGMLSFLLEDSHRLRKESSSLQTLSEELVVLWARRHEKTA